MDPENGSPLRRQEQARRIDLTFQDLTYRVQGGRGRKKEPKSILNKVSGRFGSGQLTGILGPSGAGKTSLVQVIAGYRTKGVTGAVRVNGEDRRRLGGAAFRKTCCLIMANEEMLPQLTVLECMIVSASLNLPDGTTPAQKGDTVREMLSKLGLSDCQGTRIGHLSGGQRKRLSIAQELVSNPPLVFLDEPTSGLDSQSSMQCIRLLKALAQDGRTVVCTIHQPSAKLFDIFDQIFVMAEGSFIYKGPVTSLVPYLLKSHGLQCPPYHNPADFVIEIASGEHGGDLVQSLAGTCARQPPLLDDDHVVNPPGPKDMDLLHSLLPHSDHSNNNGICKALEPAVSEKPLIEDRRPECSSAGAFSQFKVLLIRSFKCMLRDTYLCQLRLLAHVSVGLLIGVLYSGIGNDASKTLNNIGYLFFSLLFLVFTAMMSTIVTFPLEMAVFTREHLNCWYSLRSYFMAKTTADLPFQIVFPVIYALITYWMTDQPRDAARFLTYLLLSVLISITAQSLGLLIGAATSLQVSIFLGPAVTIPILLFSGFFLTVDSMPSCLSWLTYLSYLRYAYQATLQCIYGWSRPALQCHDITDVLCVLREPEFILDTLGAAEAKLWFDLVMLAAFLLLFRLSCYFVLRWRVRNRC